MKNYLFAILFLLHGLILYSQPGISKDQFAFCITGDPVKLNDSLVSVQIEVSPGIVRLQPGQPALLRSNFIDQDSSMIGTGKCISVKGTSGYFVIRPGKGKRLPQKNDLLFTQVNYPATFKGRVYHLIQHAVYLKRVTGEDLYNFSFAVTADKNRENKLLDSMLADIHYTGKAMLDQQDGQDRLLVSGKFKDQKLFAAMQTITRNDLQDFLDYVNYRFMLYAGNNWKTAEIFATWMYGGTPLAMRRQ